MNKIKSPVSRRKFIGTVGIATAAFTIVPNNVIAGRGYMQPSDTVNLASVGLGMMGCHNIVRFCTPEVPLVTPQSQETASQQGTVQLTERLPTQRSDLDTMRKTYITAGTANSKKFANIYAICDVDTDHIYNDIVKGYPKAKIYTDWREMLEKEPSIDAVVVATPDHNHAIVAANFIKEKKHVYSEKPMCKTVHEARTLRELAKEYDVVTQLGNQGYATDGTRKTVEWIQSGVIGPIREVHGYGGTYTGWPSGNYYRPAGVPIPKNLNWDLWLGPAPYKPYHPDVCHFYWRGSWDYGTGGWGDGAPHVIDHVIWALNLKWPTKIQATKIPYGTEYFSTGYIITFDFPARGLMPKVKLIWTTGGIRMPRPDKLEPNRALRRTVFYGDKGVLLGGGAQQGAMPELVPLNPDFEGPEPWIPRTSDNYADWIEAIKAGKKSANDYSISSIQGEIIALGLIAMRMTNTNIVLEYDGENGRFTNSDEANSYLHYEYRKGWTL